MITKFRVKHFHITICAAILATFSALLPSAQTTILRPATPAARTAPRARYHSRQAVKQSSPAAPKLPSTENLYRELDERYDWHSELIEDMVLVSAADKFGFVDRRGQEVIPAVYDGASDFSDGEAVVMVGDLFGTINRTGVTVIPPKYEFIDVPSGGFYLVKLNGKYEFIDRHGIDLTGPVYDSAQPFAPDIAIVERSGRFGAIDRAGNEIIPVVFESVIPDSLGRAAEVQLHNRRAPIDSTLNIDFTLLYDEIQPFRNVDSVRLAVVKVNGRHGLVNPDMHEVVQPVYQMIAPFHEGLARVNRSGRYNYITPAGKEISPTGFDDAYDFVGEYAIATLGANKGVVDHSGEFQPVEFTQGIGVIRRKGHLAIITRGGVPVNDLLYDSIAPFSGTRAIICRGGRYGFIDPDGFEIVKPIYDSVYNFEGPAARVCQSALWGLIDMKGLLLARPVYQSMEPFIDGLSRVCRSRRYGYLDATGSEAVHADYDSISHFEANGLARMAKNGRYGLVDRKGHEPVIATYSSLAPLSDGLYAASLPDGKYGYIDATCKTVIKFKYDDALPFVDGLAPVKKKDRWGVIDTEGRTVIPLKYDAPPSLTSDTISVTKNAEETLYTREGKKIK